MCSVFLKERTFFLTVLAEFLIFVPYHLCVLDWIISIGDYVKISSDGSCTAGVDIVEVSF